MNNEQPEFCEYPECYCPATADGTGRICEQRYKDDNQHITKLLSEKDAEIQRLKAEVGGIMEQFAVLKTHKKAFVESTKKLTALCEEREKEIQQLKEGLNHEQIKTQTVQEHVDGLWETIEELKGGATVQQIAEAWDACEESMSANMKAVFLNNIWMADWNDAEVDKDKSEYLRQFESKQHQEEGFKDFRIKELEKALRERGDLVPSTDEPQSLPRKEEGKDQPV
jgi:archaellum component FlaC